MSVAVDTEGEFSLRASVCSFADRHLSLNYILSAHSQVGKAAGIAIDPASPHYMNFVGE